MARIRSVKPELRVSEVVASWPREVRYFWVLPERPDARWQRAALRLPAGMTTLFYHVWDGHGQLLYVGVTGNPVERWRRHAQKRQWWSLVALITWEPYAKEHLALAAERAAIRLERPVYNRRSAVFA
jgi:predicted GIY-YIG superfamily endonuclease